MIVMMTAMVLLAGIGILVGLFRNGVWLGIGAFDDFVELSPVEPYSPAFRTVVDFDSLALRDL